MSSYERMILVYLGVRLYISLVLMSCSIVFLHHHISISRGQRMRWLLSSISYFSLMLFLLILETCTQRCLLCELLWCLLVVYKSYYKKSRNKFIRYNGGMQDRYNICNSCPFNDYGYCIKKKEELTKFIHLRLSSCPIFKW